MCYFSTQCNTLHWLFSQHLFGLHNDLYTHFYLWRREVNPTLLHIFQVSENKGERYWYSEIQLMALLAYCWVFRPVDKGERKAILPLGLHILCHCPRHLVVCFLIFFFVLFFVSFHIISWFFYFFWCMQNNSIKLLVYILFLGYLLWLLRTHKI